MDHPFIAFSIADFYLIRVYKALFDQLKLTSNSTLNSYFSKLWTYQHEPNHFVPSLFDSNRNQSVSASLLFCTYWNKQMHSYKMWANGSILLITIIKSKNYESYFDKWLVFFFEPLYPQFFISWASFCL